MTNNNRGVTIIELLIGLGVTAIIVFMSFGAMNMITQQTSDMRKTLEAEIDQSVGERIVMNDLRLAGLSFNNVLRKDDNGREFFDFEPEKPFLSIPETQRTRFLTLSREGEDLFLLNQEAKTSVMVYDPVAAYEIGPAPADVNTPASLSFQSLNHKDWITIQKPELWRDGHFVMLDTAASLRPQRGNTIDDSVPPRSPLFIGKVAGLAANPDPVINQWVKTTNPLDGTSLLSADIFLRRLPPMGGALPLVRLRAITAQRYTLEKKQSANPNARQLVRYSLGPNGWSSRFLVADDVKSVTFERKSITQKLVYFKIERVQPERK